MAVTSAITAIAALGYGVYSGERAGSAQKTGLRRQAQAQQQAESAAARQQRQAAEAYAAANRQSPDIGSILADEQAFGMTGSASTLLTGPSGVKKPKAQPTTLLGE